MVEEKGLEGLQVWQKSMCFAIHVQKELLPNFPKEENWALCPQLRRSVQSIPANIAEGYGRYYYQESIRYCYIARGSLEETFTHISMASKLGYFSAEGYKQLYDEIIELERLLNGYIEFLKKSKRGENEPGHSTRIQEDTLDYLSDHNSYGTHSETIDPTG